MPGTLTKEDYYIEDGRYVFTAHFHLKRGSCCGNKCRHCPYSPKHLKNNTEVDTEILKKYTPKNEGL